MHIMLDDYLLVITDPIYVLDFIMFLSYLSGLLRCMFLLHASFALVRLFSIYCSHCTMFSRAEYNVDKLSLSCRKEVPITRFRSVVSQAVRWQNQVRPNLFCPLSQV